MAEVEKKPRTFEPVPRKIAECPRVCTLCNVMCETLVVFNAHVAGKKHVSKIKRFQRHGTVYGPITVYIPPNQPSAFPTNGPEPMFFGLTSVEMLNQAPYDMEGVYFGNNQDAPLEFISKEKNALEISNAPAEILNQVTNAAALESDLKEKNIVATGDAISAAKHVVEDAALDSESKGKVLSEEGDAICVKECGESDSNVKNAEMGGNACSIAEHAALGSEVKASNIPGIGDALNATKNAAFDSDLKEENSTEAGDECNVEKVAALDSEDV